jgi:hypothetical protein
MSLMTERNEKSPQRSRRSQPNKGDMSDATHVRRQLARNASHDVAVKVIDVKKE